MPPTQNHHISLFYEDEDARFDFLAGYIRAGLQNHELCVFVSELPLQSVKQRFKSHGLAIGPALDRGDLRVFDAFSTYLTKGSFSADYMLANVENFLAEAQDGGYTGLRTAGEMNWLHKHPEAEPENKTYEAAVNAVAGTIPFTGLCLYATDIVSDTTIKEAFSTHPEISYGHASYKNAFFKLDKT